MWLLSSVRADWKCSLENELWTIIPTAVVLSTLLQRLLVLRSRGLNSTWEAVFPKNESYTYDFVPLALEGTVITRQPFTSGPNRPSTAPNVYLSPYSNFPELTCGAHPYIVILAALQHMRRHEQTLSSEQLQAYSTMEHIRSLWVQLTPNHINDSVLPPLETPQDNTSAPNGSTQSRVKRARTSSPS
ncbi:hypothetical protein PENSPDRAFT_689161 [Peniophora sp. CONT]|nr:hypothetical protein PENSPDRAFT_689161 [Peniophora sp. CONT]